MTKYHSPDNSCCHGYSGGDKCPHQLHPECLLPVDLFVRVVHQCDIVLGGTLLDMMEVYDDLDNFIEYVQYDVRSFGYDPYNAREFVDRWIAENGGYAVEKVIQGMKTETVPLGELEGKSLEYPVYVDVEEKAHQQMTPSALSEVICAFTDAIRDAGWLPGVYSWKWLLEPCGSDVAALEWWVCAWTKAKPCECGMWQFGGESNQLRSTTVAGYRNMDQSYAYVDYPAMVKELGLNGFKKEETVALSVPEKTAQVAEHFAAHNAHGYSQYNRGTGAAETITLSDGSKVTISGADVDCSEMAKQCVNVALSGSYKRPIDYMWTGNEDEMLRANGFTRMAFAKSKVRRGDILLRSGHTAVATSATKQAEAVSDENGGLGGRSGDQTRYEVAVNPLSSNWTYIYRYAKSMTPPKPVPATFKFKTSTECNIRIYPDALDATAVVGQLAAGKVVKCDGFLVANGTVWAHYLYRKKDRYVSLGSANEWVSVS